MSKAKFAALFLRFWDSGILRFISTISYLRRTVHLSQNTYKPGLPLLQWCPIPRSQNSTGYLDRNTTYVMILSSIHSASFIWLNDLSTRPSWVVALLPCGVVCDYKGVGDHCATVLVYIFNVYVICFVIKIGLLV